uniref:Uncharacterized protein n=1 Tax=Phlebotomus papatasi TaxID=29031 RepID=A0A1B0DFL0_PHLPP
MSFSWKILEAPFRFKYDSKLWDLRYHFGNGLGLINFQSEVTEQSLNTPIRDPDDFNDAKSGAGVYEDIKLSVRKKRAKPDS